MASCIQIEGMLQSYVDDEVSPSERLLIEEHLKGCEGCAAQMEKLRATDASVFEVLRQYSLHEDFAERVMAHLPDIPPAVSVAESLRLQAHNEKNRTRRWFLTAVRLVPVVMPVILLILAALLWLAWPTFDAEQPDAVGMVLYSDGNATNVSSSAGAEMVASKGHGIQYGDSFTTGSDSRMLLGLAGPSHITVFENSVVVLEAEREVVLKKGRVFFDVSRDARHFRVHTPDGRITVFGTSFQVDIQNAGTEVTVVNGDVMVENESAFVRLNRNSQAFFNTAQTPTVRKNIDTSACVREARAITLDSGIEEQFLGRIVNSQSADRTGVSEQVFVVETAGSIVNALLLKWTPDPYTSGHAGYTVYVSDNSLNPLFKAAIPPETFREKQTGEMRIEMPTRLQNVGKEALHITILPEMDQKKIETTFTEVAAIGEKS